MDKIIEVQNLSFGYNQLSILSNVNFTLKQGDFMSLIGLNGVGKSTIIKLLLKELTPTTGEIFLFNTPITKFKNWQLIGYVPQNGFSGNLQFPATVTEVVMANLYSQVRLFHAFGAQQKQETQKALELVGMQEYAKNLVGELSGGQQQRVLLARALVNKPRLLILDEPTTGVDTKTVQSFYNILTQLNKEGVSILMVTHDLYGAAPYVSRSLYLEDGTLKEIDKTQMEHITQNPNLQVLFK